MSSPRSSPLARKLSNPSRSSTTADAISTFLLTMVAHPHVLAKAQEELDRVVGHGRLPDFTDQDDLLYCNAMIREILRWRTVIAGGLAHCTTEDDFYEGESRALGARTTKGSLIDARGQATLFPRGQRWLRITGPSTWMRRSTPIRRRSSRNGSSRTANSLEPSTALSDTTPFVFFPSPLYVTWTISLICILPLDQFGFGRRICPGSHIADRQVARRPLPPLSTNDLALPSRSLFIVFTRLMWAFNIKNATDPTTGLPIPVDVDAYSEGFSSHPLHFECDIKPRGEWVGDAVEHALAVGK